MNIFFINLILFKSLLEFHLCLKINFHKNHKHKNTKRYCKMIDVIYLMLCDVVIKLTTEINIINSHAICYIII